MKMDELDRNGYDIHTVSLTINGQHGGWDVAVEATDSELVDHRWDFISDSYGNYLTPAKALLV